MKSPSLSRKHSQNVAIQWLPKSASAPKCTPLSLARPEEHWPERGWTSASPALFSLPDDGDGPSLAAAHPWWGCAGAPSLCSPSFRPHRPWLLHRTRPLVGPSFVAAGAQSSAQLCPESPPKTVLCYGRVIKWPFMACRWGLLTGMILQVRLRKYPPLKSRRKPEERSSQEEFHVPIIDLKGRNSALLDPI